MACAGALSAQSDMRGHWSGTIDTDVVGAIVMEIDLDKTADGWIGSFSISAQNAFGMPLEKIAFADGRGTFHLQGGPTFTGTLSADGKTLDGTFTQGRQSLATKLSRTGEAKVELPTASPAVAPQFAGKWEGTVDLGVPRRLALTISNSKDGSHATLVSLDQDNAQIPVSTITQQGTMLTLIVKAIGADYTGDLNSDATEIRGAFTMVGMSADLVFTKVAP